MKEKLSSLITVVVYDAASEPTVKQLNQSFERERKKTENSC